MPYRLQLPVNSDSNTYRNFHIMATALKPMPGDCWFCSECKYGPMLVVINPACCICSHELDSAQHIEHDEVLRASTTGSQDRPMIPRARRTVRRQFRDHKARYSDETASYFRTHQLDNTLETILQQKETWNNCTSIAIPALTAKQPTLLHNSVQRNRSNDSESSEDRNSSDYSDDDTSNSNCSTCTCSPNSTIASSTMDTETSSRAWTLAQDVVDVLAGTTDWRMPVATRPANPNGASSSKRNNSTVTGGSSDQTSRAGKRQRTAGDTRKAQPPNNQDQDDEEEEEEEDITAYIKKDANDQPGLPCIFFIQSLRRPDLPPICHSSCLRGIHRLK
jgi:hypothetical protein